MEGGNVGQQPLLLIPAGPPPWGGGDLCPCAHACVQTETEK